MPELPEVETIMTLVKQRVENKKIKKTKVLNPSLDGLLTVKKLKD
jgi:formamidopyrimidine-DNA glycosylase